MSSCFPLQESSAEDSVSTTSAASPVQRKGAKGKNLLSEFFRSLRSTY